MAQDNSMAQGAYIEVSKIVCLSYYQTELQLGSQKQIV